VEDDERVQQGTAGLLRTWGCEVVLAASGTQAIDGSARTHRRQVRLL
jgi:CheY-like chemotaxis protein